MPSLSVSWAAALAKSVFQALAAGGGLVPFLVTVRPAALDGKADGRFFGRACSLFMLAWPEAAPAPILGRFDEVGPQRIALDIAAEREKLGVDCTGKLL